MINNQTTPHKQAVSPGHMLIPVSEKEAAFEATIRLSDAIEHARFLGLSLDALRATFEDAIQSDETPATSEPDAARVCA